MLEKDFQRKVVGLFRGAGWLVCHFSDSRRQIKPGVFVGDVNAKGFPDLVLVKRTRIVFAELKSEKGTVTKEQRMWLDALSAAGCETYLWRPKHYEGVVKVVGKKCWGENYGTWNC